MLRTWTLSPQYFPSGLLCEVSGDTSLSAHTTEMHFPLPAFIMAMGLFLVLILEQTVLIFTEH